MTWPDEPSSETSWPPPARETPQGIGGPPSEPHRLAPGGFYVYDTTHGYKQIDLTGQLGRHPVFRDVASFAHYLRKYGEGGTFDIFADEEGSRIVAVLDDGITADAHWRQHTATLSLQPGTLFLPIAQTVAEETGAVVMFGTPGD